MITRSRMSGRRWFPLLVLVPVLLASGAAPAGTPGIATLLEHLAPDDAAFASDYVQVRESGLLTEEVRVSGRIRYQSPGRLEKSERDDDGERTVHIAEGTVRIDSADETRSFPLSRSRQLEALMDLLEAFARGDAELLQERFTAEIDGSLDAWQLRLQARSRRGSGRQDGERQPLRLHVSGDGDGIERIRLESSEIGRLTLELTGDAGE